MCGQSVQRGCEPNDAINSCRPHRSWRPHCRRQFCRVRSVCGAGSDRTSDRKSGLRKRRESTSATSSDPSSVSCISTTAPPQRRQRTLHALDRGCAWTRHGPDEPAAEAPVVAEPRRQQREHRIRCATAWAHAGRFIVGRGQVVAGVHAPTTFRRVGAHGRRTTARQTTRTRSGCR